MSRKDWNDVKSRIQKASSELQQEKDKGEIISILTQVSDLDRRDRIRMENLFSAFQVLKERKVSKKEIKFRSLEADIHYFFKFTGTTTNQMLTHLCSSLARKYVQEATWSKLEDLLREASTTGLKNSEIQILPILLVLDGLDEDDRNQVRRIVLSLKGRVRAVISVDEAFVQEFGSPNYEGLRNFSTMIKIPELCYDERLAIFQWLMASGLNKKQPANFKAQSIIERVAAGNPLYLKIVVAYHQAAAALKRQPEPPSSIGTDTLDIIIGQFIPMVENELGSLAVRLLFDILKHESRGANHKDVRALMLAIAKSESLIPPSDETIWYVLA